MFYLMQSHIKILIIRPPKKPPTIPPTAPSTTIFLVPSLSQYYLNYCQDGTDAIIIELIYIYQRGEYYKCYQLFLLKKVKLIYINL